MRNGKTLLLTFACLGSSLGAIRPITDSAYVRSFSVTPLYSSGISYMRVQAQVTGSNKLDFEIEIANDLYPSGILIASFSMAKAGSTVVSYDNRYTRPSNHLIFRVTDLKKNTTSAYKVETTMGSYRQVNLGENKSFSSNSDITFFKPSTLETTKEKEILEFEGFEDYYIPPYYHNLDPTKFKIKQDAIISEELKVNSIAFQINNRNGVFDGISKNANIRLEMQAVKEEDGLYHLEFKEPLYVNRHNLKMSSTSMLGYVKTKYLYFPINEMQYQGDYSASIIFSGVGIDQLYLAHTFKLKALINTVGDCHNSEYCVLSS